MKIRCKTVVIFFSEKKKKRQNLQRILEKKTPKRRFGYSSDTMQIDDFGGQEKRPKLKKYCFSWGKWPISRCKFTFPLKSRCKKVDVKKGQKKVSLHGVTKFITHDFKLYPTYRPAANSAW